MGWSWLAGTSRSPSGRRSEQCPVRRSLSGTNGPRNQRDATVVRQQRSRVARYLTTQEELTLKSQFLVRLPPWSPEKAARQNDRSRPWKKRRTDLSSYSGLFHLNLSFSARA
jgi:hypothetical protein